MPLQFVKIRNAQLELHMDRIKNLLLIAKSTRSRISLAMKLRKKWRDTLCLPLIEAADNLIKDWRDMLKNQRRLALDNLIRFGHTGFSDTFKTRFELDKRLLK